MHIYLLLIMAMERDFQMKLKYLALAVAMAFSTPALAASTAIDPTDFVENKAPTISLSTWVSQAKAWAAGYLTATATGFEAAALKAATSYTISANGKTVTEKVSAATYNSTMEFYKAQSLVSRETYLSDNGSLTYTDPDISDFSGWYSATVYGQIAGSLLNGPSLTLFKDVSAGGSLYTKIGKYFGTFYLNEASIGEQLSVSLSDWSYSYKTVVDSIKTLDAETFLKTANIQINGAPGTISAVPGPEAGAGLGALAMGGVALFVKRRRKDQSLAA